MQNLTTLLADWKQGNERAREELFGLIYQELQRMAGAHMRRETPGHTLTPTALVHELYLRLAMDNPPSARDRQHFYAIAATVMRRILVDYARRRLASKRGGGERPVAWQDNLVSSEKDALESIHVNDALDEMAALDPLQAKILEMRYFGGLTAKETAEALDLDAEKVEQEWRLGKLWLRQRLR